MISDLPRAHYARMHPLESLWMRRSARAISSHPGSVLSLLLLILACGDRSEANQGGTHVADAPELSAVEELRIGSVNDPDAGFSHIGGVAVDTEGSMYVLENQDRQIRVYNDQGRLLRRIGGEGEGPGEFRRPMLIGLQHDTLAIADLDLGRVTLFLRTGQLLETVPAPPVWLQPAPGFYVMVAPAGFTRDGFTSRIMRTISPPEGPGDSISVPHVTLDRTGQIMDTLRFERWNLFGPQIRVGNVDVRLPSGPSFDPLYVDGRDNTYLVQRPIAADRQDAEFTVTRLTHTSDTIYHRNVRYQPSAFPAEVVDSIVARAVRPYLGNPEADSGAIVAAVHRASNLPPYQPPIVRGRIGADDVLWLQLNDDGRDRHRWLLLGPEGQLHGLVSLPRDARIEWSSGDVAIAVLHDDFDVPWLVRYRLRSVKGS